MEFIKTNSMLIFSLLGVVVLALGIYLGILLKQLKMQKVSLAEEKQKNDEYVSSSIHIIALATLQGQCDLSECCLRIKNLLDYYPEKSAHTDYLVIHEMYEEIKHFPTHQKRRDQTKQETYNQDKERFRIEDKYRDRLFKSLELLKENFRQSS